jgi:hypothetical protein
MALDTIASLPGQHDINDQFVPGQQHIHKSLNILKQMQSPGHHYQFGALTADFYGYTGQDRRAWLDEAGTYPTNVQEKIKAAIVQALSNVRDDGSAAPIQVKLRWDSAPGGPDVWVTLDTSDPAAPFYTIKILNCISPMASALAERRKERKKT